MALCLIAGGVHAVSSSVVSRVLVMVKMKAWSLSLCSPIQSTRRLQIPDASRFLCFCRGKFPALFWPFSCSSGFPLTSSCLGSRPDLCPDLFPLSCDHSPFSDVTLFWVFLRTLASLIRVSNSMVPYQKLLMHLPFVLEEGPLTSLLNSNASQHFSIICDRISCIKPLLVQHQVLPHVCWSNLVQENAHPELFRHCFSHLCLIFVRVLCPTDAN